MADISVMNIDHVTHPLPHDVNGDDDEDEIVSSIPIYLTHPSNQQFHILHYPLRPVNRGYQRDFQGINEEKHDGDTAIPTIQYKPVQNKLSLTYALDSSNSRYTHNTYNANHLFPSKTLKLMSCKAQNLAAPSATHASASASAATNECIGVIHHHAMYLTPIHSHLILKPDITYIDQMIITEQQRAKDFGVNDSRDHDESMDEEDNPDVSLPSIKQESLPTSKSSPSTSSTTTKRNHPLKPLLMKFQKPDNDRIKALREKSYAYIHSLEEKEEWITLAYYHENSVNAKKTYESLYTAPSSISQPLPIIINQEQYIDRYMRTPTPHSNTHLTVAAASNIISHPSTPTSSATTKSRPPTTTTDTTSHIVEDQLLSVLRSTRIISTAQLIRKMNIHSMNEFHSSILPLLEKHTHFVQGNWIIRSTSLYTVYQPSNAGTSGGVKRETQHSTPPSAVTMSFPAVATRTSTTSTPTFTPPISMHNHTRLALCRNYLISVLSTHPYVNKSTLSTLFRLHIDENNELFKELCVKVEHVNDIANHDHNDGIVLESAATSSSDRQSLYQMKIPPDPTMMHRLTDIHTKHVSELNHIHQHCELMLKHSVKSIPTLTPPATSGTPIKPMIHPSRVPQVDSKELHTHVNMNPSLQQQHQQQGISQTIQLINTLIRQHGVVSRAYIESQLELKRRQLRELHDTTSYVHLISTPTLSTILSENFFSLTPTLYAKKTTNDAQTDRYRHIVAALLTRRGSVKKHEVDDAIRQQSNGDVLRYQIYMGLMKEFAVFDGQLNLWKLKSGKY